ncbi:MAG: hypothetical protein QXX38_01800 [Candidatus Aenigmatarchaeota archaeon]
MKGQAAMEFLMTYGWAILIVIAVVAALYAMGVFKLPTGGLGKCSPCFPPGSAVAYVDHNKDNLVVRVGPYSINETRAVVGGTGTTIQDGPFSEGALITYSSVGLFAGDVEVTIEYKDARTGLSHTAKATLHGA